MRPEWSRHCKAIFPLDLKFTIFSKRKLDKEQIKYMKINRELDNLKKMKRAKLEEEHQLKFGGYIDL